MKPFNEKMNDVLNKLDATPPVIVPEEERQVSCFYTKKNLTLGDEKFMWLSIWAVLLV
jgi:hypothetical protein